MISPTNRTSPSQRLLEKKFSIGDGLRWEEQAVIGYLAGAPDPDGVIRTIDPNPTVYDKARHYARRVKRLKQEAVNPGKNEPCSWLHGFLLNHVL